MDPKDQNTSNQTESSQQHWDKLDRIAKLVSITMIPVVLALVGWFIQRQLQEQSVQRDYVQLAVSILREKEEAKADPILRAWAVELLNKNSPVPIQSDLAELLKTGKAGLPVLDLYNTPPSVRNLRDCLRNRKLLATGADPQATAALLRLSKDALEFFTHTFLEFDTHEFIDPADFNPDYARPQFELVSAGLIKENQKKPGALIITPLGLKARELVSPCLKEIGEQGRGK